MWCATVGESAGTHPIAINTRRDFASAFTMMCGFAGTIGEIATAGAAIIEAAATGVTAYGLPSEGAHMSDNRSCPVVSIAPSRNGMGSNKKQPGGPAAGLFCQTTLIIDRKPDP